MAELWKIEYSIRTGGSRSGIHETEYIEGDQSAHTRLMQLECDRLSDTGRATSAEQWPWRLRAAAWLRLHPVETPARDPWHHVDHISAWRLVDGEWLRVSWELVEPSIAVALTSEVSDG